LTKRVGGATNIRLVLAERGGDFPINSRLRISLDGGVTLTWASDYFAYDWNSPYLRDFLRSLPGAAVDSPFAGDWTLNEIKSLTDAQGTVDVARAAVVAKLGAGWTVEIDYASFELHTRGSQYRTELGRYLIDSLVGGFAKADIGDASFDADVVEALNGLVSSAKTITFRMAPRGDYAINSRLNLSVNAASGVTLVWAADYFAYDYAANYLAQWVLANC
jgi:hypothetical protein